MPRPVSKLSVSNIWNQGWFQGCGNENYKMNPEHLVVPERKCSNTGGTLKGQPDRDPNGQMENNLCNKINHDRTSRVAQWLRICLPMQGTRVRALVREDPTCRGATKPMCHNYWACVPQLLKPASLEPLLRNKDKPPQWEARAPQQRVAPDRRN